MITVSIAEEESRIGNLIKQMLLHQGISYAEGFTKGECEYLFLPVEELKRRDVVLLDKPVSPLCAGECVTVLNADERFSEWPHHSLLLTYGLNPLSTITSSSICVREEETSFLCCLQRSMVTLKGELLEPQEFSVMISGGGLDVSEVLGFVALGLLFSIEPKVFEKVFKEKHPS